jgi:hypothetical protein
MSSLELHGADLPERRMPASGIVERFQKGKGLAAKLTL